jgi:hypothetical protein
MSRVVISRGGTEENPYDTSFNNFQKDLYILRELNSKLANSIKKMETQSRKTFRKKLTQLDADSRKEFEEFTAKLSGDLPSNETITFTGKAAKIFSEFADRGFIVPNRLLMFIRDMGLVYLVAELEDFLRHVIEISFSIKPEILSTCKKSITFEQLMKLDSLASLKEEIMEKEATEVINQDIEQVKEYFQDKFNINISEYTKWAEFKERFYRRNVLIHNSGMPNALYVKKTGVQTTQRLTVSKEYLDETVKMSEKFAGKITEELKNKFKTQ